MTTLISLARALAADRGIAQSTATVRHVHLAARPLVLIPLALAGEANAPLAAMVGDHPESPMLLTVSQPRNRDERFAFATSLARVVVGYVEPFCSSEEAVLGRPGGQPTTRYADAPQILVPSPAGVAFLRLLGRSTRFRRPTGEYAVDPVVPALGRWLTFFSERAEHPGSCLMLAMTDALALHWATGQSPVEDQNLAALVGWIDPSAGQTGSEAAAAAEDPLVWPPAGPATDPTFDNEVLAPLVAACDAAASDPARYRRAEAALRDALAGQLRPTWRLMWQAAGLLRGLPPGAHVAGRWAADRHAFTDHAARIRNAAPPQPRRDSAVAAAWRLDWLERAQASYAAQRALDDPLVMAEQRMTGEAFVGTVVAAETERFDASGRRRTLRPRITITTDDQVQAEPGAVLVSPTRPSQKARLVSLTSGAGTGAAWTIVLELSGGMGNGLTAPPGAVPTEGEQICMSAITDSWQPAPWFPPREQTPWTHGGPPPDHVPHGGEAAEEWS